MIKYGMIFTIIAYVISFGVTFLLLPLWIRYAKKNKLVGRDMNKNNNVMIPESGGIVILVGIFSSLFYYTGVQIFYFKDLHTSLLILGAVLSILCVAIIGALDDFRGWKIGLRQSRKALLTIFTAIPFLLVNINRTTIDIPFFGIKDVGLAFPLLFIPMAIVGASNGFNMLAGYNGLEAGMGIIILGTFSFLSYLNSQYFAAVISLIGLFALLAFIIYNWYPARIFPGDTMTYSIGAFIAICAILGRIEKYALLLFIPYFIDFLLPLRKKMKVEAFAKVNSDNSFDLPYKSFYDLTHIVIFLLKKFKKKVYEKDVVLIILGFEVVFGLLCIVIACISKG